MDFRILGPLEVKEGGRSLSLGGQKQRTLLAVLLLRANETVASDQLIDAMWEEDPPGRALKGLQVYVSRLRRALGEARLESEPAGYRLRLQPGELDVELFEQLRAEGKAEEALALWRGMPLADFRYQRFAQAEIARLEEARITCLEDRIEADLSRGRHRALVGDLEALVQEHPLRERLRGQLMLSLYRSGRQAEALDVYQEARRALIDGLGIEPAPDLRKLHQLILRQDPLLDPADEDAPIDASRGVFVGRERELGELSDGVRDAFAGHGRLFLVEGEPGIGKSRVVEELIARARGRGMQVLAGRCWEAGGAPPYWPWVQAIRACVRESDSRVLRRQLGTGAAALVQLLPELRELFPDRAEPLPLDPESARFRLFENVISFLKATCAERPLLLTFDDLHAADEPSLLLLRFVARELSQSRLLVVCTYRDVDPALSDPLATTVTELVREPATSRIELSGLGKDEVGHFIELSAGEAPSRALLSGIYEKTEGNPLFVGELVRLLAVEKRHGAEEVQIAVPQSVRDVIGRRLRHLSEECNRLLELSSVLGREFRLETLIHLADVPENDLLARLDEASAARVLSEVPGDSQQLRFTHVVIRDTLYEGLTRARRVELHRQAVEALEALYGQRPGAHLAEFAHHAIAGRDFERGQDYARQAGDRALGLLAYEEAARLYGTALEAGESNRIRDDTRCQLLLSLAEAESRAGNRSAASSAALEAADIARRLGLPYELAQAAAIYGGRIVFARAGQDRRLVPLLQEGLATLGDEHPELRARLLARLAGALRDQHSRDRRDALSREAVKVARRTGNEAILAYSLAGRAHAIIAPDTLPECLALGNELRAVAERSGDREQLVTALILRHMVHLVNGDIPETEGDLSQAARIADELRQPAQLSVLWASQAMLALARGDLNEAETIIAKAFELGEVAQPDLNAPFYWLQRQTLCDFRGRIGEVEQPLRDLVDRYPARTVFRCALAYAHARLGRMAHAKQTLENLAQDDYARVPFDQEWLYSMSLLAETAALVGDKDAAAAIYRLLLPWEELNAVDVSEGIRGAISRYLGLLATTLSFLDDAETHFTHALEMNQQMGLRPWLAYTQDDYARMLLCRNNPNDRLRAAQLLDDSHATFKELNIVERTPAPPLVQLHTG